LYPKVIPCDNIYNFMNRIEKIEKINNLPILSIYNKNKVDFFYITKDEYLRIKNPRGWIESIGDQGEDISYFKIILK